MSPAQFCPLSKLDRLLLATDRSTFSEGAIREAINFAKRCSSWLHVMSVMESNPEYETIGANIFEKEQKLDPEFVEMAVDFIRTYADRCHHGKEEDILFRELGGKKLTDEHRRTMEELVEEHRWGRKTTVRLVEANERYIQGEREAMSTVTVIDYRSHEFRVQFLFFFRDLELFPHDVNHSFNEPVLDHQRAYWHHRSLPPFSLCLSSQNPTISFYQIEK